MTLYQRLPRPVGLTLERDLLRVYMMCNGQRNVGEVADLTRLSVAQVQDALRRLQRSDLVAPVRAASPERAAPPSPVRTQVPAREVLEDVLWRSLGEAATPHIERLRACPSDEALRLEVPRLVAKLKLVVNRQVGEALERAYHSLPSSQL